VGQNGLFAPKETSGCACQASRFGQERTLASNLKPNLPNPIYVKVSSIHGS